MLSGIPDDTDSVSPRVLVVDDEPTVRTFLAVCLEMDGFEVLEAPDGASALELAKAARPQLVTIDLMMPDMDGWELSDRLRADEETAGVAQMIISARPASEIERGARTHRVDAWLTKPFDFTTLVARAHEILDIPAQRGDSGS
jgi:two-component system cell cycle response regulator